MFSVVRQQVGICHEELVPRRYVIQRLHFRARLRAPSNPRQDTISSTSRLLPVTSGLLLVASTMLPVTSESRTYYYQSRPPAVKQQARARHEEPVPQGHVILRLHFRAPVMLRALSCPDYFRLRPDHYRSRLDYYWPRPVCYQSRPSCVEITTSHPPAVRSDYAAKNACRDVT